MENKEITQAKQTFAKCTAFFYLETFKEIIEKMDDFDRMAFMGYELIDKKRFFEEFFTDERFDEIISTQKIIANDFSDSGNTPLSDEGERRLVDSRQTNKAIFHESARLILFEEDDPISKLLSFISREFPGSLETMWDLSIDATNQKFVLTVQEARDLKNKFNNESFLDGVVHQSYVDNHLFKRLVDERFLSEEEFRNYVKTLALQTIDFYLNK